MGKELLSSINQSNKYKMNLFIDDNLDLKDFFISSIPIYSKEQSKYFIEKLKIKKIFIAISNLTRDKKKRFTIFFELRCYDRINPIIHKNNR